MKYLHNKNPINITLILLKNFNYLNIFVYSSNIQLMKNKNKKK